MTWINNKFNNKERHTNWTGSRTTALSLSQDTSCYSLMGTGRLPVLSLQSML